MTKKTVDAENVTDAIDALLEGSVTAIVQRDMPLPEWLHDFSREHDRAYIEVTRQVRADTTYAVVVATVRSTPHSGLRKVGHRLHLGTVCIGPGRTREEAGKAEVNALVREAYGR